MKLVDKNKNDDRKERKAPLFKKKDKKNRGRERPKHHKARTVITIAALSIVTAAAALGIASDRITAAYNERTTFDSDTAAKIGKDKISVAEFMLASVDVKNGYETQYGDDIWTQEKKNAQGKTETYERIAKEDILEQIRFTKAMAKEGEKRKIELTKGENKTLNETAKSYYNDLKKAGVSSNVVSLKDVREFYKDNYYAQKVYYKITGDNTVESKAASGSAISENSSSASSAAEAQKIWTKYVNKWYPDFDYERDINWDILDQIKFTNSDSSASGDASESTDTSTTENNSTESEDKQ